MGIINKRLKGIDIRKINANGSISNEQIVCAKKILCSFDSDLPKCNYVIVKGEPQVGKTGVLYALVNIINKLRLKYVFNVKKVLYITGDNSKDLIKQQKNRSYNDFMTFSVEDDVEIVFLKRSDFKKIMETIDSIDNSIIFIDESHYGTRNKTNQLPYFLKHYGVDYLKNTNLEEHNIRIISCSATPHCEIASDKVECKMTIRLEPGEGYIGQKEFIDNNCAIPLKRNAFDKRCVKKELPNILNYAYNHLKNIEESTGEIKCAIFRISKKSDLDNLKKYGDDYFVIEEFDTTNEKSLNYDSVFNRIDSYCEIPRHRIPNKYLMIVIKDAFRMGISIREREDNNGTKNNIAVLYDFSSTKDKVEVTQQGLFGRICGYREKKDNKWKNVKIYLNENHYDIIKTTIECGCVDENGRITSPVKPVIKTKSVLLEDINGLVCASEAGEDLERLQAEGKVYYIDVPEKNDYYYEYDATDFYLSKVGTNFGGYDNFKLENLKTKNCVFVDTLIKPFLRTKSDLCDSTNYIKKPGSRKCGIGVAENEDNFVNALKDPNKKMLVDVYKVKPNEIGKYAWQALLNMDEMDRKNSPKISVSVKVSMLRPYKRVDVKDIEKINKTAYTMTTE